MSTSSLPDQPATSPEPEVYEPVAERVPRSSGLQHVLVASQAYASANTAVAVRQVAVTLALIAAGLAAAKALAFTPWHVPLVLVLAGLWVRTFVLQHDCGHLSLFRTRRANDTVGQLLAFVTGVPYHAWRTEHNWHHAHTSKLSRRGLDSNTSPPTVDEAQANPKSSIKRAAIVSPQFIFAVGPMGFMVDRKRPRGYVFFKQAFRWPVPDAQGITRSVIKTNIGHAALMAGVFAWLGWATFLTVVPVAMAIACGFGAWLFWVQHNFEHTYYAPDETWDFVKAGLHGSSYLKLGALGAWFTAHIGLHHVHHVNVRIPNYRLDEARRGIPELAEVAPLDGKAFLRCFECHFWDDAQNRLVTLSELGPLQHDQRA
jgi:omega-6 fatty acid desaturase (delta-12 desaturase)